MKGYELIKVWRRGGFRLSLYDTYKTDSMGKSRLAYRLTDGGKVIFEGEDFCCSPTQCIDSLETVYQLLGFLTLKPGDTDSEYFEKYTPGQLAWCQSNRCDELGLYVYDFENREQLAGERKRAI